MREYMRAYMCVCVCEKKRERNREELVYIGVYLYHPAASGLMYVCACAKMREASSLSVMSTLHGPPVRRHPYLPFSTNSRHQMRWIRLTGRLFMATI